MKGRTQTPDHIEKRAAANRGQKRSPEMCAKFSEEKRGKKQSLASLAPCVRFVGTMRTRLRNFCYAVVGILALAIDRYKERR